MPKSRSNLVVKNDQIATRHRNTQVGPSFRPKIVYNSNLAQTESSDKRLDFYKFKKLSCAKVLKQAIKTTGLGKVLPMVVPLKVPIASQLIQTMLKWVILTYHHQTEDCL